MAAEEESGGLVPEAAGCGIAQILNTVKSNPQV